MNKKGMMKILEAFIAILIITGVLFVIVFNKIESSSNKEETIYQLQTSVLKEISDNEGLRRAVLSGTTPDIAVLKDFIKTRIPKEFDFEILICEIDEVCNLEAYRKEIYANEVIISSTLQEYKPKKLKLFIWEKG